MKPDNPGGLFNSILKRKPTPEDADDEPRKGARPVEIRPATRAALEELASIFTLEQFVEAEKRCREREERHGTVLWWPGSA